MSIAERVAELIRTSTAVTLSEGDQVIYGERRAVIAHITWNTRRCYGCQDSHPSYELHDADTGANLGWTIPACLVRPL
jgi:hypothetical protein